MYGIIPDEHNVYKWHLEKIKKEIGIDKNILEVASGYLPIFAQMIAQEQIKIKAGTICGMDTSLLSTESNLSNMTLISQEFKLCTDPKEFELIAAIMPCGATKTIIDYACQYGINFYIAFCDCVYSDFRMSSHKSEENLVKWIEYAEMQIKEHDLGDLCVAQIPAQYGIELPVIYNKRR